MFADGIYVLRIALAFLTIGSAFSFGQSAENAAPTPLQLEPEAEETKVADSPGQVDVVPSATDEEIRSRLQSVLEATEWFEEPRVEVDEGVVFLRGGTRNSDYKLWAGKLASSTQDVVAVVNRIEVLEGPYWDLSPAWDEILNLSRAAVQAMPLFLLSVGLLGLTWFAAMLAVRLSNAILRGRISSRLLRHVLSNVMAVPVFLFGLYIALRVSGLSQMAATVLGGTGLIGLVIGIAFRDITENFLASILISMDRPFAIGDVIEVNAIKGVVHSVTTRGTILMELDGNHIQIPNSTIYKSSIRNFTTNPKIRQTFTVGISYGDSISRAQEVAFGVLRDHPVVLADPEPLVLVEQLNSATVDLRIYYWIDGQEHSVLQTRSSVIRLMKGAFDKNGITMPDEAREVVFPQGVPVRMLGGGSNGEVDSSTPSAERSNRRENEEREEAVATTAEGDLRSETEQLQQEAAQSRLVDEDDNLLVGPATDSRPTRT